MRKLLRTPGRTVRERPRTYRPRASVIARRRVAAVAGAVKATRSGLAFLFRRGRVIVPGERLKGKRIGLAGGGRAPGPRAGGRRGATAGLGPGGGGGVGARAG